MPLSRSSKLAATLSLAALADPAATAPGAQPVWDWVDISDKSKPGEVFLRTASVRGAGDRRTAEILLMGNAVNRLEIEFDCVRLWYRVPPTPAVETEWLKDAPADVERVCTNNFAGMDGYMQADMDRLIAAEKAAKGQP